jgi:hypothetical protein
MKVNRDVRIEISHGMAVVEPSLVELLGPCLSYTATYFQVGGPLGHERRRRQWTLYRHEDDRLLIRRGLVEIVVAALQGAGYRVSIQDRRVYVPAPPGSRFELDTAYLVSLPPEDRQLLLSVSREPQGVIEVAKSGEVAWWVEMLGRLYPRARTLIPVATRKEIKRLHRELCIPFGEDIKTVQSWAWRPKDRLLVCSLQILGACNIWDWDMILVPNALHALAPSHVQAIRTMENKIRYVFLPADRRLSHAQRLRLHCLCGPTLYRVPARQAAKADVQVFWCVPPWSPPVHADSPLARKRAAYWHHDQRNQTLAELAVAFCEGREIVLGQHGLFVSPRQYYWADQTGRPSVTLLVESAEHGRVLLRYLPGWTLLDAVPAPDGQAQESVVDDPFAVRRYDRKIITLVRASMLGALDTDVLIRATGDQWPLALSSFPPVRWPDQTSEVLLIDIADDFDGAAQEASRRRQRDYAARGWLSEGMPSWLLAENAFL